MKFGKIITLLNIIVATSTLAGCRGEGKLEENKHEENIKDDFQAIYEESKAWAKKKGKPFSKTFEKYNLELKQEANAIKNDTKKKREEFNKKLENLRREGRSKLAAFLEKRSEELKK